MVVESLHRGETKKHMSEHKITVNGVNYDATSGLPHDSQPVVIHHDKHHAASVHSKTQRSTTLNRSFTKKPAAKHPSIVTKPKKSAVQRSPHITKFAPHPQTLPKQTKTMNDMTARVHPHVAKAHAVSAQKHTPKPAPVHKPAAQVKNEAIAKALHNAAPAKPPKKRVTKNHLRKVNIASASLAILLLAGYLTYLNLPSISVRVAAAQAGIDASYPSYRPTGYSLSGPVAYSGGEVKMKFKSNSGPQYFALNQVKSSWDSSALQTNYIETQSDGDYATYNDAGLTIYTYGSNAAWVNGGILYTVEGDAPLSNEQIRHMATSL